MGQIKQLNFGFSRSSRWSLQRLTDNHLSPFPNESSNLTTPLFYFTKQVNQANGNSTAYGQAGMKAKAIGVAQALAVKA